MWVCQAEIMWYSGQPTTISVFCHVIFILFLLILGNLVVQRYRPKWALEPGELLVIYTMLCLASAVAGHDMIEILISTLCHLDYYGPIEGRYSEIRELVPSWLLVTDPVSLKNAHLGQDSVFNPVNFRPWLKPLTWWFFFIMALCSVMWGLNLVFRKQWTENEKLAYPVIQLPMMMTTHTRQLLKNKLFWIAFGLSGGIDLVNGLHVLHPLIPKIPIVQIVNLQTLFPNPPWSAVGFTWVSFYPFVIGLCFFMPLDLAFSCWFFFIFWKLQRIFTAYIGVHGMPGFPFVEEQTAGGYYAIALIAIWISRRHILRIVRLLLGREEPDSTPLDYREARLAFILIVVGLAYLFYFCHRAGMGTGLTVVFFLLYFMISIAVTRMRAELGPPSHDLHHVGPHRQIVRFFGPANMNDVHVHPVRAHTMAMFGLMNFFNRAYRGHPMPHGMEAYRIAERRKLDRFRYTAAMGLALAFGTLCAFFSMLWIFYRAGASAQVVGPGEYFGREAWDEINIFFTMPEVHQWGPTYAILIGILTSLALAAFRMNLPWWPFHPVGYAVSGSWSMDQMWACVFVAWLIKLLLLRYGGAKAYQPAVPFFIGLMLGDFVVGGFWQLYGIIMQTQVYHFWPY